MKTLKYLTIPTILLAGMILAGCYRIVYVRDPGSYNRNNNSKNNSYSYQDSTYNNNDSSYTDDNYGPYYDGDNSYGFNRYYSLFWGNPFFWNVYYWGDPFYWGYDPFFYYPHYGFHFGIGLSYRHGLHNYGYFNGRYRNWYSLGNQVHPQKILTKGISPQPSIRRNGNSGYGRRGSYGGRGSFGRGGGGRRR
jgi:hypothetical protein